MAAIRIFSFAFLWSWGDIVPAHFRVVRSDGALPGLRKQRPGNGEVAAPLANPSELALHRTPQKVVRRDLGRRVDQDALPPYHFRRSRVCPTSLIDFRSVLGSRREKT